MRITAFTVRAGSGDGTKLVCYSRLARPLVSPLPTEAAVWGGVPLLLLSCWHLVTPGANANPRPWGRMEKARLRGREALTGSSSQGASCRLQRKAEARTRQASSAPLTERASVRPGPSRQGFCPRFSYVGSRCRGRPRGGGGPSYVPHFSLSALGTQMCMGKLDSTE